MLDAVPESILAEKLGAESIHAYDTDPWAVNNTHENVLQNHCKHIKVSQGTIDSIDRNNPYDIILANINLNVLLGETPQYVEFLEKEGLLILSGFYIEDVSKLVSICEANRLQLQYQLSEDGWACLIFKKS
jgi:ribosomal protein L11 methyltransferase